MIFSDSVKYNRNLRSAYLFPALISMLALIATFVTSNTDYTLETKAEIFAAVILIYLLLTVYFYIRLSRLVKVGAENFFDAQTEEKLLALEEAGKFFGASLKPADMFRLIANRVNEIVPFTTCVFYQYDEGRKALKTAQSYGQNSSNFEGLIIERTKGLAGKTLTENAARTDNNLVLEKNAILPEKLENLLCAICIPLRSGEEVFGVLTLYSDRENAFAARQIALLEAVGERVSPFLLSSITFENNIENALTDKLTELPNERAFYLVLENQIAESQRFREQRPLTILSIDIKKFDELNQRFGHNRGNQILSFTARLIKGQLRQMDFLSRASGDEFLAVLPTASEEITKIIVERIERAFAASPLDLTPDEKEFIKLNFGAASFLTDGETAQQLLSKALLRKKQAKNPQRNSVLWFSREYVN